MAGRYWIMNRLESSLAKASGSKLPFNLMRAAGLCPVVSATTRVPQASTTMAATVEPRSAVDPAYS